MAMGFPAQIVQVSQMAMPSSIHVDTALEARPGDKPAIVMVFRAGGLSLITVACAEEIPVAAPIVVVF